MSGRDGEVRRPLRRICVFAGARPGSQPRYREAARDLGRHLADEGISVVFGGGRWGLMGELADAALERGGEVLGVIPETLVQREGRRRDLTRLEVVDSMHERKQRMADLSNGFVSLPGGLGTLEETCEMLTWAQLGFHRKPCGLLNVSGYYDPLVRFLDRAVAEGFLDAEERELLAVADGSEPLLRRLREFAPPRQPAPRRPSASR